MSLFGGSEGTYFHETFMKLRNFYKELWNDNSEKGKQFEQFFCEEILKENNKHIHTVVTMVS
jgi:hypothetical protein